MVSILRKVATAVGLLIPFGAVWIMSISITNNAIGGNPNTEIEHMMVFVFITSIFLFFYLLICWVAISDKFGEPK